MITDVDGTIGYGHDGCYPPLFLFFAVVGDLTMAQPHFIIDALITIGFFCVLSSAFLFLAMSIVGVI